MCVQLQEHFTDCTSPVCVFRGGVGVESVVQNIYNTEHEKLWGGIFQAYTWRVEKYINDMYVAV